jgi:hypothetical protein
VLFRLGQLLAVGRVRDHEPGDDLRHEPAFRLVDPDADPVDDRRTRLGHLRLADLLALDEIEHPFGFIGERRPAVRLEDHEGLA